MVATPAIETKDLATRYEVREAVNGATLDTVEGKCCGLLKPNGARKTTTTISNALNDYEADKRLESRDDGCTSQI